MSSLDSRRFGDTRGVQTASVGEEFFALTVPVGESLMLEFHKRLTAGSTHYAFHLQLSEVDRIALLSLLGGVPAPVVVAPRLVVGLGLTVRAQNILLGAGIRSVEKLLTWSEASLLRDTTCGRVSLNEIKARLGEFGWTLPSHGGLCSRDLAEA